MAGWELPARNLPEPPGLVSPKLLEHPPGIAPFTGPSTFTPREYPKMGDPSPPVTPIGQPTGSSLLPPLSHPGKAPPEAVLQARREAAQAANADADESEEGSNPWVELN